MKMLWKIFVILIGGLLILYGALAWMNVMDSIDAYMSASANKDSLKLLGLIAYFLNLIVIGLGVLTVHTGITFTSKKD